MLAATKTRFGPGNELGAVMFSPESGTWQFSERSPHAQ